MHRLCRHAATAFAKHQRAFDALASLHRAGTTPGSDFYLSILLCLLSCPLSCESNGQRNYANWGIIDMLKSHLLLAAALGSLFGSAAHAQAVYVTADRLIDPVSGRVVEGPALLIEDGVVTQRATAATLSVPADATVIDLSGKTILPGLIDMHVHLDSSATKGRGWSGLGLQQERSIIWAVTNAERTLRAGFTTVRNTGSRGYGMVALRDAISEGEVLGPRMFVAGPPVGILGGHCSDSNLLPAEFEVEGPGVATGPWEMREKVRRNIKYGVDLIKTCSTGGVFSKGTTLGAPQGTVEELTALVEESHARGLKVASHAHGTVGIKNAIRAGVDTIDHASFLDDEAIRMAKRKGVIFVPDIYNTEYTLAEGERLGIREESLKKEREVGTIQRESFTKAVRAGAKVAFGTDAAIFPHGDNANQFSRMVRFGMTPMQAIQAATVVAAEGLGKQGALGCLDAGCHADLIAVDADPLVDVSALENVSAVVKAGALIE